MSKITEQLVKYAQEEKQAHEEYIKDFSSTTIAHLMAGGVSKDKAAALTKEACLRDEDLVKSVNRAIILEKVAEYITALESENVKLTAKVQEKSTVEKQAEVPEHLKKLASLGFTEEELDAMKDVPDKVLEKVANSAGEPWGMGSPSGPNKGPMDPLLEFILS